MSRNPIAAVWAIGALAALIAYVVGPDHLLSAVVVSADRALFVIGDLLRSLSASAVGAMHAVAVGLLVTFVGLCLLAIRNGQRGRAALVAVSALFVWLVWSGGDATSNGRWLSAFVLAAVATLVMSSRLHGNGRS